MKTEFDDALRGVYTDHDEVRPEQATDYRQVAAFSVGSVVFGVLSCITFLHWSLAILPLIGIIFGIIAMKKILHAPDEIGGFALTTTGLALSIVFFLGGYSWLTWNYFNSVPAGYERVDFVELAGDLKTGKLPEKFVKMAAEEQKVFIQGYMYPGRRLADIEDFTLVRTTEHCKFCSPTKNPFDMIPVHMLEGKKVMYQTRAVRVGGILKIDPDYMLKGSPPYYIEADVFRYR